MTQLTPESNGLVLQPPLARTVRWTNGIRRLPVFLRGAPKFSLLVLLLAMICALFAPPLTPYDPLKGDLTQTLIPPNLSGHLLGTDHLGRALLSRLIYGARISVTVGFLAVFVSGTVGSIIAVLSGLFKGWL